jgi:mRNA interferase MazF
MAYAFGELLLVPVVFTSQTAAKKRPVLVIHDGGDDDLLVTPVTDRGTRSPFDVPLGDWRSEGLRLPSTVRLEKLATVEKSLVLRPLGSLSAADSAKVRSVLRTFLAAILPP